MSAQLPVLCKVTKKIPSWQVQSGLNSELLWKVYGKTMNSELIIEVHIFIQPERLPKRIRHKDMLQNIVLQYIF